MSEKDRMRRFALMVRSGKQNSYNKNHQSYEEWLDDLDKKVSNVGADKWKALDKIDYKAIPDTTFTRDRTGAGSIEYLSANEPGIRYPNGYYVLHPMPGNDVILYNPNDNDEQDIRLDALHIMPEDATYDALNSLYRDKARDSDVSYNALLRYADDVLRYGLDNVDSYELYFNNEADGLLRNMFIEGTPEYIEGKHYYPDKLLLREWNKDLLPYIDRILNYLETGERPKDILPEVTKSYNSMPNSVLVDRDSLMMDSSGNFYDEDGNMIGDSVILPELNVRAKDREKHADEYKSAFDPNGAGEFAATMMNSPLLLADYAFNRFIDAGKGEYGKTDYKYTPVQTTMQRVGETLSPTRWAGTLKTGFKESPWSENNPGLTGNPYFDLAIDVGVGGLGIKGAKRFNRINKIDKNKLISIEKWTPEQWTAAQDAAIAKGDMTEAQRLRDLHFQVSAPNTQIKDIQYHGSKGNAKFNVFDPNLIGETDKGWAGRGYYFTPSEDYAKMYGLEPRAFYINAQKVHDGTAATYFGRENGPAANAFKIIRKRHNNDGQQILDELASSDAIRTSFPQTQPYNGTFEEIVTRNNNQMKLADAVTYDDNGVRIPLGKRDNFESKDIRYNLVPNFDLPKFNFDYNSISKKAEEIAARVNKQIHENQVKGLLKAEEDVFNYLGSEKHIKRIMQSGKSREEATRIAQEMWDNAMAASRRIDYTTGVDGIYRNVGEYDNGFYDHHRRTFNPKYTVMKGLDKEATYENAIHELGGHGATLGYRPDNSYTAINETAARWYNDAMERWSPNYKEIYEHNSALKPVRKNEYKLVNDPYIEYLEDVDEYAARSRAANIDPKGINRLDFQQLYKYFTKESVDKLKDNVWVAAPLTIGGTTLSSQYAEGGPKVTLVDSDKVRMNDSGVFSDDNGNVIGDSIILPEFVVNGVDINRINKHANTEYNDNTRIGLEKGTLAKARKYDDTVNLATSIPGTLITTPLWGPTLLNAGDAFLGTTLGRGMTSLATNPYTQAGLLSAGLADTIDRRLIKGLHPDYSENPFMAGVLDVFDASMVAAPAVAGYRTLSNNIGRLFGRNSLKYSVVSGESGIPKIQKPHVKRYSMFDDADLESFTINDMPETKGDIYEPVVVNGKRYPSKLTLMNKVELVKPEHLNDAHQLALREIRDYVLSDEFRQRLINNGFDPDKYQHALLRYLDTKVKYGELLPGTYGISKYASDPNDMEIILNNKVLDTDYDALIHELLHAQTRHLDSESLFFIKNKIDELLMDIMKHNESIQPQMSLDAMKASDLTTDLLQKLSYVEEPQEFRARVGASVLDAKRRGIDFDDYVDNHNYDLIRSLKYFYNKDDIKRYAKRFLAGLPFGLGYTTYKTLTDNTDNNRSYGGRIGYSNHKFDEGGPKATYGKPYYSYDKNMQIETDNGKPILNYSATLPEVNIIPDNQKSPADRNEARRFREKVLSDNAEREAIDYTQRQIMLSKRDWDNSLEKKALGYAQDFMTGVGIGADIVSGLPIYSSLKGSRVLSEADSLPEYIEGGLWLAPIGGAVGKEAYNVGKNVWNTSKDAIPSALEYAYNRNKRLSEIGTIDDYGEYIKTVFPQSMVKDIQYHIGPKGLTELKPSTGEIWNTNPGARGIYVTPERSYIELIRKFTTDRLEKPSALTYMKRNVTHNGWKEANEQFTDVYPLLIDTRNPMRTRGIWTWGMKDKKYQKVMNNYDAIINSGPRWWQNVHNMPETIVPKSEQVHILGTDADVEGFRNFMRSKGTSKQLPDLHVKINGYDTPSVKLSTEGISRFQGKSPIPTGHKGLIGYRPKQKLTIWDDAANDMIVDERFRSIDDIPKLRETINSILSRVKTEDIRPEFLNENAYVNSFRDNASRQFINVNDLSHEDIAKILTEQYNQLSSTSNGILKDNILWRTWGESLPQSEFNWQAHMGSSSGNKGFWGQGNYFGTGVYGNDIINQPYMIKGIEEIGYDDLFGATNTAAEASRNGKLAGSELATKWMSESPETRMVAATEQGWRNEYGWLDNHNKGIEVVTQKNKGIKALNPDLTNGNGTTFVRDWNNPNVFKAIAPYITAGTAGYLLKKDYKNEHK